jgi:16S rRNA (cytidine1402-2'-O)-methyltransferase
MVNRLNMKGKLYLIPVSLTNENQNKTIPAYNIEILNSISIFVVENIKTARRNLRTMGFIKPFQEVTLYEIDKHNIDKETYIFIEDCKKGFDVGLMSESGLPCIADPGNRFVIQAHKNDIKVVPLSGASSIFLALMASGLNGQHFEFHGYLPIEKSSLTKKIKELEKISSINKQTQIFIETPYRNEKLFATLLSTCKDESLLCIATELTSEEEYIKTYSIKEWKSKTLNIDKKNTVFLLQSR